MEFLVGRLRHPSVVRLAGILGLTVPCLLSFELTAADHTFPEDVNVTVSREFSRTEAWVGDTIAMVVEVLNSEPESIRGFYYSDHVPGEFQICGDAVWIDEMEISDFLYERDAKGSVYQGCVPHRWVIDLPQGEMIHNAIAPNQGSLRIVCSFVCWEWGMYLFPGYSWIGVMESTSRGIFGYTDLDVVIVRGPGIPCGDANGSGDISFGDALYLRNYYYQTPPGFPPPVGEGDVNLDGRIMFGDALYLVNYIYGNGPEPCEP